MSFIVTFFDKYSFLELLINIVPVSSHANVNLATFFHVSYLEKTICKLGKQIVKRCSFESDE